MDGIVNWRTFEKMTNWAVSKSDEDARRWDACCGTGRLTLPLARKAKHVYI